MYVISSKGLCLQLVGRSHSIFRAFKNISPKGVFLEYTYYLLSISLTCLDEILLRDLKINPNIIVILS